MVLKHHPDKKGDLSAVEAKMADEYFARITKGTRGFQAPEQNPQGKSILLILTNTRRPHPMLVPTYHFTAYELLCNKKQRRMYDSVDEVDDSVPAAVKNTKQFFSSFPAAFERNER
jgi:DnaJ-class molecular chaperone